MGLAWELHELIQDFVDGKLSPERELEVQAFLDKHPTARKVADQYRMVTQPEFETQPEFDSEPIPAGDSLVDRVMSAIPTAPWYASLAKRDFLTSFAVLAVSLAVWYLADFDGISSWLQVKLLPKVASLGLINDSIMTVLERISGLVPLLGASILITAFYGALDKIMALGHKTRRA